MKLKKNLFSFILAICLIVPAMFALTACGKDNGGKEYANLTLSQINETYYRGSSETKDIELNKTYYFQFTTADKSLEALKITVNSGDDDIISNENEAIYTIKITNATNDAGEHSLDNAEHKYNTIESPKANSVHYVEITFKAFPEDVTNFFIFVEHVTSM